MPAAPQEVGLGLMAIIVAVSYLLGSIPFGLLAVRLLRGLDLRQIGSGKTGATNAARALGTGGFIMVALADTAKGVLAILLVRTLGGDPIFDVGAALAAVSGHIWPLFAGFRGGRGVATAFGALLVMSWPAALLCLLVFCAVLYVSRYASLGSIAAATVTASALLVLVWLQYHPTAYAAYATAGLALLLLQHRDNIRRLLAGTERKFGR